MSDNCASVYLGWSYLRTWHEIDPKNPGRLIGMCQRTDYNRDGSTRKVHPAEPSGVVITMGVA